MTKTAVHI